MIRYRKKPVVVEAIQFTGVASVNSMIEAWGYDFVNHTFLDELSNTLSISTLEGEMQVSFGDFVIKGIANEFYPCKEDIFKASYELANNS